MILSPGINVSAVPLRYTQKVEVPVERVIYSMETFSSRAIAKELWKRLISRIKAVWHR